MFIQKILSLQAMPTAACAASYGTSSFAGPHSNTCGVLVTERRHISLKQKIRVHLRASSREPYIFFTLASHALEHFRPDGLRVLVYGWRRMLIQKRKTRKGCKHPSASILFFIRAWLVAYASSAKYLIVRTI